MLKIIVLAGTLLAFPLLARAAPEVSIMASDISFSNAKPLSGQTVRIYATVRNTGDRPAQTVARFFIDSAPLGADQPLLAVVGKGTTVFVDWQPSEGYYKIGVELFKVDPVDTNPSDNRAEVKDFLVDLDSDKDGKYDTEDWDDDNDGVDDGVEIISGTNPLKWDTDGDGTSDKDDAYPNDPARSKKEAPVTTETKPVSPPPNSLETSPSPAAVAAGNGQPATVTNKSASRKETAAIPEEPASSAPTTLASGESAGSLAIMIAKSRLAWRNWDFEALGGPAQARYLWDFGDKKLGEGRSIKHDFPGSGVFKVTLSLSADALGTARVEDTVVIGFWHLSNPYVQIILGLLGVAIVGLAVAIAFNLFPKYAGEEKV